MKGRVVAKDGKGKLTIQLMQDADEHCKACGMGDSCGLTKISSLEINPNSKSEAFNIDEYVDVEVSSKIILWLSVSVYILPLFTMLCGAFIFSTYSGGGDKPAILGSVVGLAIGVLFNIFLNKYSSLQRIVQVRRLS